MELDDEIARLEAELAEASSDDGSASDDGSDASDDDDDEPENEEPLVYKTHLSEEDLIPALPAAYLPTVAFKALAAPRAGKETRETKIARGPKPIKGAPKVTEPVVSRAQKQAELTAYIRGYEPSEHKPFYCRLCSFQGSSVDDLAAHRASEEHKAAAERDQKACFCKLCRKQFTSPAQLTEHLKGKNHKDMLLRRSDPDAYKAQRAAEDAAENAAREAKWAAKRIIPQDDHTEAPSTREGKFKESSKPFSERDSAITPVGEIGWRDKKKFSTGLEPAQTKRAKTAHSNGAVSGEGGKSKQVAQVEPQRASQKKKKVDNNALRLLAMVRSGNQKKAAEKKVESEVVAKIKANDRVESKARDEIDDIFGSLGDD